MAVTVYLSRTQRIILPLQPGNLPVSLDAETATQGSSFKKAANHPGLRLMPWVPVVEWVTLWSAGAASGAGPRGSPFASRTSSSIVGTEAAMRRALDTLET